MISYKTSVTSHRTGWATKGARGPRGLTLMLPRLRRFQVFPLVWVAREAAGKGGAGGPTWWQGLEGGLGGGRGECWGGTDLDEALLE